MDNGVRDTAFRLERLNLFSAALAEWRVLQSQATWQGDTDSLLEALDHLYGCTAALRLPRLSYVYARDECDAAVKSRVGGARLFSAGVNLAFSEVRLGSLSRAQSLLRDLSYRLPELSEKNEGRLIGRFHLIQARVLSECGRRKDARRELHLAQMRRGELTPEEGLGRVYDGQARLLEASLDLADGHLDRAEETLVTVLARFHEEGLPGWELSTLGRLSQVHALQERPREFVATVQRIGDSLTEHPCSVSAVDIARLTVTEAMSLGMVGRLKDLKRVFRRMQTLFRGLGRPAEGARAETAVVQVTTHQAGQVEEVPQNLSILEALSQSPFAVGLLSGGSPHTVLAVHVAVHGGRFRAVADTAALERAAVCPLDDRALAIQEWADGATSSPECPGESKVLALFRTYLGLLEEHRYGQTLEAMSSMPKDVLDPDCLNLLVELHAS